MNTYNNYELRNISPGGTVWAVPQITPFQTIAYPPEWGVSTAPRRNIIPVVQGFSPNEARRVFGPTVYGGRSAVVAAPPMTIIPGYVPGAPAWGKRTIAQAPMYTISQVQAEERLKNERKVKKEIQNELKEKVRNQPVGGRGVLGRAERVRTEALKQFGIFPRRSEERPKKAELFIINAFDNTEGNLSEKINSARDALRKLNYFAVIMGESDPLQLRIPQRNDAELSIWTAYDQGGIQAAEVERIRVIDKISNNQGYINLTIDKGGQMEVEKVKKNLPHRNKKNAQELDMILEEAFNKGEMKALRKLQKELGDDFIKHEKAFNARMYQTYMKYNEGEVNPLIKHMNENTVKSLIKKRLLPIYHSPDNKSSGRVSQKYLGPVKAYGRTQAGPITKFNRKLTNQEIASLNDQDLKKYYKFLANLEKKEREERLLQEEEFLRARMA
jgi:hypothetical protein